MTLQTHTLKISVHVKVGTSDRIKCRQNRPELTNKIICRGCGFGVGEVVGLMPQKFLLMFLGGTSERIETFLDK